MDDEEILACVAEALGLHAAGGTVSPLEGKQGLFVCRVCIQGSPPVIFKAVRESGRPELRLSALLSEFASYAVAHVLCASEDERRGLYWLVMQDEGAMRLSDTLTTAGYARAASTLARLQVESLGWLDKLRDIGIRSIDSAGWEEMALGLLTAVQDGSLRHVCDRAALMEALWNAGEVAADASALPPALVHGDLHAGNIALTADGEARLLDWGSAYIGSAFLGLAELLWPAERCGKRLGDLGPVRKAYTDRWTPVVGKPGRLASAIAACEALARMSLVQEALRRPDRFGDFGAANMANHFVDASRHWERVRAC